LYHPSETCIIPGASTIKTNSLSQGYPMIHAKHQCVQISCSWKKTFSACHCC